MASIYEMYGRLAENKAASDEFIGRTLGLLRSVRDGVVAPRQLTVTDTGWEIIDLSDEDAVDGD